MKISLNKANRKGGFTLIELMVVIAILAVLGSVSYGPILDHMNDGERQKAQSNLKSVHSMLQQFKTDHADFPCDATGEELAEKKPDINFGELTGGTSNCYFRQLLMDQANPSEKNFYAQVSCGGKSVSAEGDDKVANGRALERGENSIAYVMLKGDEGQKNSVKATNAPLAICNVYPSKNAYSGDKVVYDNSSFRGHIFVLACDGSVSDKNKIAEEDDNDSDKATLKEDIFPETKKGRATAPDYIVLPPDL